MYILCTYTYVYLSSAVEEVSLNVNEKQTHVRPLFLILRNTISSSPDTYYVCVTHMLAIRKAFLAVFRQFALYGLSNFYCRATFNGN